MNQATNNVLIIDSSENRKKGMVDAFRPHTKVYVYNFRSHKIETEAINEPGYWEEASTVPEMLITMIHVGDEHADKGLKNIASQKKRIWYGGYGIDDNRLVDLEPIISRCVQDQEDCPSEEEVLHLIDFALGKKDCPSFCSQYSLKERLFDKRHRFIEDLQVPTQYNWDQTPPKELFMGFEKEWEYFSVAVKNLLEEKKSLSPFDDNYVRLLKEFIRTTIEKDFKN